MYVVLDMGLTPIPAFRSAGAHQDFSLELARLTAFLGEADWRGSALSSVTVEGACLQNTWGWWLPEGTS